MHFKWTRVQHFFVLTVEAEASLCALLLAMLLPLLLLLCGQFDKLFATRCGSSENHNKKRNTHTYTHTHTQIAICDRRRAVCEISVSGSEQNVFSVLQMKCDSCELKINN